VHHRGRTITEGGSSRDRVAAESRSVPLGSHVERKMPYLEGKQARWGLRTYEPTVEYRGDRMSAQVPVVDYLVLDDDPHLEANKCTGCGARFFDRRNACAACGGTAFARSPVPTSGEVRAFTIVSLAAPGIPVPFVAAVVDCDGISVRANLINIPPDPDNVKLGAKVRLATYSLGEDSNGVEAISFGFEPLG
jgi:uncharacterized protein